MIERCIQTENRIEKIVQGGKTVFSSEYLLHFDIDLNDALKIYINQYNIISRADFIKYQVLLEGDFYRVYTL